jgi:hypothetical protein
MQWFEKSTDCWELRAESGHVLADVTSGVHGLVHYRVFAGNAVRRAGCFAVAGDNRLLVGRKEVDKIIADDVRKLEAPLFRRGNRVYFYGIDAEQLKKDPL